jgi:hypothetical protein
MDPVMPRLSRSAPSASLADVVDNLDQLDQAMLMHHHATSGFSVLCAGGNRALSNHLSDAHLREIGTFLIEA